MSFSCRTQILTTSSPATPRNSPGIAFNQRSDQVQERLMLGMSAASTQKRADVDIGHLSARWEVRSVPDEQSPGLRLAS